MNCSYSMPAYNSYITQSIVYDYTHISNLFLRSSRVRPKRNKSEYQAKLERGFKQIAEGKLQYHDLIETKNEKSVDR